jgi:hypothetical protein
MMMLHGFDVRNLTGGIRSWQATHDVERSQPAKVHISALAE